MAMTPEQKTVAWLNRHRPSFNRKGLDNPVRAKARVILADLHDTQNRMHALFNPQSLPQTLQVNYGKLQPIGGSHPVKMYGSTGDWNSSLELYLSAFGMAHWEGQKGFSENDRFGTLENSISWLSAFCYPQQQQMAPPPLLLVWPNVMNLAFVVESIDIQRTRFDTNLNTTIATVTLAISDLRQEFVTAEDMAVRRFSQPASGYGLGGAGSFRLGGTGTPLNLTHPSKKKTRR